MQVLSSLLAILSLGGLAVAANRPINLEVVRSISYRDSDQSVSVRRVVGSDALFYQSKMSCDVDGAPNAYHPLDDRLALDVIGSAEGKRVNDAEFGPLEVLPNPDIVVFVNGAPYVQPDGDYKGFYVSMTSLRNSAADPTNPGAYLDARKAQYIVLPNGMFPQATLGDVAVVYDPVSKNVAYAVYGDIGPNSESGEASMATIQALKLPVTDGKSSPAETRKDIFYLVFPGSHTLIKDQDRWPYRQDAIDRVANRMFRRWGGTRKIKEILAMDGSSNSAPAPPSKSGTSARSEVPSPTMLTSLLPAQGEEVGERAMSFASNSNRKRTRFHASDHASVSADSSTLALLFLLPGLVLTLAALMHEFRPKTH